jgi:hypothetical protein
VGLGVVLGGRLYVFGSVEAVGDGEGEMEGEVAVGEGVPEDPERFVFSVGELESNEVLEIFPAENLRLVIF